MNRAWMVTTVLALAMLPASCAGRSGAVEIPAEELPFPVVRSPTPGEAVPPTERALVFFVRDGHLVGVRRSVSEGPQSIEERLRAVLTGPSEAERLRNIRSLVPGPARLLGVTVSDAVATVDLSSEFQSPAVQNEIALRVAQVVWTLTEVPGVSAVSFQIDGEPSPITTGSGIPRSGPVTRAEYATLAPPE